MRIRSKGLGRIELVFDLKKVVLTQENGHLVITGKTQRPVIWDFRITIADSEVPSLVKLTFRKPVISLLTSFLLSAIRLKRENVEEGLVHKEAFQSNPALGQVV